MMVAVNPILASLIGVGVAALGAVSVILRVPMAAFFRQAQERRGAAGASTQTPALLLVVGVFFFLVGAAIAIGVPAGWLHLH